MHSVHENKGIWEPTDLLLEGCSAQTLPSSASVVSPVSPRAASSFSTRLGLSTQQAVV